MSYMYGPIVYITLLYNPFYYYVGQVNASLNFQVNS